eukprot:11191200-Lingulodinium_polyedra.AAC.1
MRTAGIAARVDRANVRFASRCDNARPIRPRRCVTFVRRRNDRRIARSRARKLARAMEYASLRFARRCGRGRSMRPHHC